MPRPPGPSYANGAFSGAAITPPDEWGRAWARLSKIACDLESALAGCQAQIDRHFPGQSVPPALSELPGALRRACDQAEATMRQKVKAKRARAGR